MRSSLEHRSRSNDLVPWLALALPWLLFEVPMALGPDRISLLSLRPTGEMLATLTVFGISFRIRRGAWVRWMLVAFVAVLALVRVDRAIFFVIARSEPLLYDQLFLVKHLFVLVNDLLSVTAVPALVALTTAIGALVFLLRWLLRATRPLFEPERRRTTALVALVAWTVTLLATAFGPRPPGRPWVRWMLPDLVKNIAESRRIYLAVNGFVTESPYRRYDAIRLSRRPNVLLFFVESYGRLIAENPAMRSVWEPSIRGMEGRLQRDGWSIASAFATAPVSGGRSWLAVGSILMGKPIRYEAVFRQLIDHRPRVPTLVDFFARQGYETVHLAPSDRKRPGVEDENRYGYDRYLRFDDLDYHGRRMGWGIVPDQYSLGYADEHVLSKVERPLFFHFHMVSSHAAWMAVPAFLDDWRKANTGNVSLPSLPNGEEIVENIGAYSREPSSQPYMGALTAAFSEGYVRTVLYDLRVIEEFLKKRTGDDLVIVMGDHQPPVVSPEDASFDVPMHVFARDRNLLDAFRARGFTDGLVPPRDRKPAVTHAEIFSLLVRALGQTGHSDTGMKVGD